MHNPEVMSLVTVTAVSLKDVEFGGHLAWWQWPCTSKGPGQVVTLKK